MPGSRRGRPAAEPDSMLTCPRAAPSATSGDPVYAEEPRSPPLRAEQPKLARRAHHRRPRGSLRAARIMAVSGVERKESAVATGVDGSDLDGADCGDPNPASPNPASPHPAGTALEAPITAVTVFRDGARVVRAGAVDVAAGLRPVVLGGLPPSVDRESVRVALRGRGGRDELAQMADHLSASTAGALELRREIAARKRSAQRELQAAEQRLAHAEKRTGAAEFTEVSASIEAEAATRAEVELTYHVPGASWQPLYDLGLSGDRLSVSYLGQVTQRTGEDWPAVPLTLSTDRKS